MSALTAGYDNQLNGPRIKYAPTLTSDSHHVVIICIHFIKPCYLFTAFFKFSVLFSAQLFLI